MELIRIILICSLVFIQLSTNAAEVVIDSNVRVRYGDLPRKNVVAFPSDQVGYVFYSDNNRALVYKKTTDGGATWGNKVTLHNINDSCSPIIWYDKWTPGNTGSLIHIIHDDDSEENLYYIEFDTSDDSYTTAVDIDGSHTGAFAEYNRYYITKATDGVLYAAHINNNASGNYAIKCSSNCSTGGNWSDAGSLPFSQDVDGDIILMPIANGDIMGINQKNGGGGMVWSIYDSSAGSWDSTPNSLTSSTQNDIYKSPWGAVVNPDNYNVTFSRIRYPFESNGQIEPFLYDGNSWDNGILLDNNNSQLASHALAMDANNGDIYATTIDQNHSEDVYYRTADSIYNPWSGYNDISTINQDNRSLSINLMNDERIYGVWIKYNGIGTSTLYGTTVIDLDGPITADSLLPYDNGATGGVTENLQIMFNKNIETQSGNIVIKKLSENLTVETIDIQSAQVTGNGTTTLTINPGTKLKPNTSYYVTIEASAIDSSSGRDFDKLISSTDWNFTTNSWYKRNWKHRIKVKIPAENISAALSDFPVYIDLNDLSSTGFFSDVQSDGDDIRITNSDGETELAFELVSINTGSSTGELHFKADSLSASADNVFYIYYGNKTASAYSNTDTYGSQNVWTNSYTGVWHLQEEVTNAADEVLDSTSGAVHGASTNMTTSDDVTAKLGKGLNFPDNNDKVTFNFTTPANTVSTSLWFNANSLGSPEKVILDATISASQNKNNRIEVSASSKLTSIYGDGSNYSTYNVGTDDISTSTWYHMTGTSNSSASKLYQDGVLVSNETTGILTPASGVYLLLGTYRAENPSYAFNGIIDEVRYSNVVRSADWVTTEYSNQSDSSSFYSISEETNPQLYQVGPNF